MPKKMMMGAPAPAMPAGAPPLKMKPKQGGTSRIKNLGTYAHPTKKKGK